MHQPKDSRRVSKAARSITLAQNVSRTYFVPMCGIASYALPSAPLSDINMTI